MWSARQYFTTISANIVGLPLIVLIATFGVNILDVQLAYAQTLTVLHNFAGPDGEEPYAGLAMDRAGNLYGTTPAGGNQNNNCYSSCGVVFRIARGGSGWVLAPLYDFEGGTDGSNPLAVVTIGPDGAVYGTTAMGGGGCTSDFGCGTIFKLTPPARICQRVVCPWTETVLYRFADSPVGATYPEGGVVFDAQGNFYGTTVSGGTGGAGTVYKMTPSGGGWTLSTIYNFQGGADGSVPITELKFDHAGNLYGTTIVGGVGNGNIFRLMPAGDGWSEQNIYSFLGGVDGFQPQGGVVIDSAGNLYGGTVGGGTQEGGVAYELTPNNDGSWTYSILADFSGAINASLAIDASGDLYGTTYAGGSRNVGEVFELRYTNGSWTNITVHSFDGPDGAYPIGAVLVGSDGSLYGTATLGGAHGRGTAWAIMP
jgi:uncharacterized repeat protein (TIGR03803 family)